MPVVCLVPVGLLLPRGFLHWLRAGLGCVSVIASILQSQDGPAEYCKALPGRGAGKPLWPIATLRTGVCQNHLEGLLKQVLGPIPRDSVGLEWRPENVHF